MHSQLRLLLFSLTQIPQFSFVLRTLFLIVHDLSLRLKVFGDPIVFLKGLLVPINNLQLFRRELIYRHSLCFCFLARFRLVLTQRCDKWCVFRLLRLPDILQALLLKSWFRLKKRRIAVVVDLMPIETSRGVRWLCETSRRCRLSSLTTVVRRDLLQGQRLGKSLILLNHLALSLLVMRKLIQRINRLQLSLPTLYHFSLRLFNFTISLSGALCCRWCASSNLGNTLGRSSHCRLFLLSGFWHRCLLARATGLCDGGVSSGLGQLLGGLGGRLPRIRLWILNIKRILRKAGNQEEY